MCNRFARNGLRFVTAPTGETSFNTAPNGETSKSAPQYMLSHGIRLMTDAVTEDTLENSKSMSLIVTKGTLDWGYPPFILATTAAAMGLNVSMFFTFYGLNLLHKKLDLGISTLGNPGMKMPMMGMHMGMPNMMGMIPGVDGLATGMMKNMIKKKGVASIEELREAAVESDVTLIACQMTMDLFEYELDDLIDGPELGGAATYIETALKSDINLFI